MTDRQLQEIWQQVLKNRFVLVKTSGGKTGQKIWLQFNGKRNQGQCFSDIKPGECLAVQTDEGEWWLLNTQPETISQKSTQNIEFRRTQLNPKVNKGSLQVLFYEIVQAGQAQVINWYIGGDRPVPLLIHSEIYGGSNARQIEDGVVFTEYELSDLVNLGGRQFIACIGNKYETDAVGRFPVNPNIPFWLKANFFKIIYINNGQTTEYDLNYLQGYDHTKAYRYLGEGYLAGTPRVAMRSRRSNPMLNYYQDLPNEYFGKTYFISPSLGELSINATTEEYSYSTSTVLLGGNAIFTSNYSQEAQTTRTFQGENIISIGRGETKITEYLSFDQQNSSINQFREIRFYKGDSYTLLNTSDGALINHFFLLGGGNRSIHNLSFGDIFTILSEPNGNFFYEAIAIDSPSQYFSNFIGQDVLFSNIHENKYWIAKCKIIAYDSVFTLQILEPPRNTPFCSFATDAGSFILNNGSYYNFLASNSLSTTSNAIFTNNYLSPISNLSNTTDFKKTDPGFIHNSNVNFLVPRYTEVDLYGSFFPGGDTSAYFRYTDNRFTRLIKDTFYRAKPVYEELVSSNLTTYIEKWKIIGGNVIRVGTEKVRAYQLKTDTLEEDLIFRDFLDIDYCPD